MTTRGTGALSAIAAVPPAQASITIVLPRPVGPTPLQAVPGSLPTPRVPGLITPRASRQAELLTMSPSLEVTALETWQQSASTIYAGTHCLGLAFRMNCAKLP
jgi:hypothetical protein